MSSTNIPSQRTDTAARVTDLVRQLSEDSRRLAGDEIRLAKLEVAETVRTGSRGAMLLGISFGAAVIALSALTICVIAALSLATGRVWIGALVTGAIELLLGYLIVHHGAHSVSQLSHPLPETRATVAETARRIRSGRAD